MTLCKALGTTNICLPRPPEGHRMCLRTPVFHGLSTPWHGGSVCVVGGVLGSGSDGAQNKYGAVRAWPSSLRATLQCAYQIARANLRGYCIAHCAILPRTGSQGEPEQDAKERALQRTAGTRQVMAATQRLLEDFSLESLGTQLQTAATNVQLAMRLSTLNPDLPVQVQKLNAAFEELQKHPFSPSVPQAVASTLVASAKIAQGTTLNQILALFDRQHVMMARTLVYEWFEHEVKPKLLKLAPTVAVDEDRPAGTPDMLWLERLLRDVNSKIDCSGPKSMKLSPDKYLLGFSEADKSVPCSKFGKGAREERIYRVASEFLSICLGCKPVAQGTRQPIASRFIRHLVDHAGPCALLLNAVWKVFQRPDKFIVGTTSPVKIHLAPEELVEWQRPFRRTPSATLTAPNTGCSRPSAANTTPFALTSGPLPPSSPTAHHSPPVLIIWSNFFVWPSSWYRSAPATLPPDLETLHPEKQRILRFLMDNTDHRLPIRRSAHGYLPLLAPGRPLHQDRIRSVQGLFSLAQFRSTTYHSPFAIDHTFFQDPAAFFNAVRNLLLSDFTIDNAYGGHMQISRSHRFEAHTERAYKSACEPAMHYWLLGQDLLVAEPKARGVKGKEKTAPKSSPLPELVSAHDGSNLPKRSYEELLKVVTNKTHPFPLCGDLGGHLLAADYADAGICDQPDKHTMAHVICKIDAGAVAGLRAHDYIYADTLNYAKQASFIDLFDYVDSELTPDEKARLEWSPICLEHTLCKYSRIIVVWIWEKFGIKKRYTSVLKKGDVYGPPKNEAHPPNTELIICNTGKTGLVQHRLGVRGGTFRKKGDMGAAHLDIRQFQKMGPRKSVPSHVYGRPKK
ncbi:hypothetical protein C8J57DRAFT_1254679 [Mycena rebaudengoi]|nr:hypothetical protein C8J57DRAFT_1254679 [Mycena rebaudengoi]